MFSSMPLNQIRRVLFVFGLVILSGVLLRLPAASSSQMLIAQRGVQSVTPHQDSGNPEHILQPSLVAASFVSVTSLWGGARESIALKSDGTVWTFGINSCDPNSFTTGKCGKLGDGTQIARGVPVQVHGPNNVGYLTSITAIMGGEHDNYAIKSDGTLWAWGANFTGQLGNGTFTNSVVPVQVSGLISVTALGGRGYHNLAVTSDGKVWDWGWNGKGQLGNNYAGSTCPGGLYGKCSDVPVEVIGVTNPLTVTGGGFFSLALMPDHTLRAWGANERGELGDGSTTQRAVPVTVSAILSNVVQVSAGWFHAVALTSDGKVWTWGDNGSGAIGNGVTSTVGVSVPVQVPGLSNVIGVSGGDGFTGILKGDGTVWTWGGNNFGELGDGTYTTNPTPTQVSGINNVTLFAARDYHSLAVKSDGTVWAWGSGGNGELGDCQFADSTHPVQVLFPTPASPSILSPLIVTGSIGLPFIYPIDVTGTQPITLSAVGLPAWSAFNGSIISGTPNITATSIVTLTANNSFGCDVQLLHINVIALHYAVYLPVVMK